VVAAASLKRGIVGCDSERAGGGVCGVTAAASLKHLKPSDDPRKEGRGIIAIVSSMTALMRTNVDGLPDARGLVGGFVQARTWKSFLTGDRCWLRGFVKA
jgi:hypothetical protein